jgi:bla regulator protein blaR1
MGTAILEIGSGVLKYVAEPAARSLALAAFVAVALAALRDRSVSLKDVVWRGVLVAALAMPFLGLYTPMVRVPVPIPAIQTRPSAVPAQYAQRGMSPETGTATILLGSTDAGAPAVNLRPAPLVQGGPAAVGNSESIPWPVVFVATYLFIAALLFVRVLTGAVLGARLARSATPIGDAAARRDLAASAHRAGLRRQPLLAESEALVVPVTVGVLRPAVLLPTSWREWETGKLAAVVAHEVSHVSRRDALMQRLALIHRAVFWFSPLAWWLERQLAELAERMSDEAALAAGAERTRYAETLLSFIAALENSRSRVWWQGVAMAKRGQAEKRLDRILAWRSAMPKRMKKSAIVAAALLAAPVIAFTASVHPFFFNFPQLPAPASPQAPPPASARPVVTPGPAPQAPALAPDAPAHPAPAVVPVAPTAAVSPNVLPAAPVAPVAAMVQSVPAPPSSEEMARAREALLRAKKSIGIAARRVAAVKAELSSPATREQLQSISAAVEAYSRAVEGYNRAAEQYRSFADAQVEGGVSGGVGHGVSGGEGRGIGYSYSGRDDWGPRFVIVTKGTDSVIMSGSSEDAEHAKALRSKIPGDFVWFEHDEKPYIIRDEATVDRAKKLWEPEQDLGRKQEALGKQQEALGKQQEELGEKMQEVRVKIPDLSAQMAKLAAEIKQLSANGGTVEQIGDLQSRIGELQSQIGEIQSQAGRQQGEIGRQQGELGRKQGELGRQQGELGRQQGDLARQASREMRQLLDDAMAKGLAQPE